MPDASTKGHSLGNHTWWSLSASLYNGDLGTEPPSGLGAEPLVREDFDPEIGRSLRLHNLRGCPICPRIRRTFGGWPLGSVGVSQTGSVGTVSSGVLRAEFPRSLCSLCVITTYFVLF